MASTKPLTAVDSQSAPTTANTLLAKSARGASLLIILQVASRGLTFAVNQILLRFLSPQLLAISTQLEVYSITVLLFARESLRIALQRQSNSDDNVPEKAEKAEKAASQNQVDSRSPAGRSQAVVNLSYISLILGMFFAVAGAWIWTPEARVLETPYFREALMMYGIATFVELLAEPCFVVVQQKSEFGIRARAESVATFLRCIVTCSSAAWAARIGKDIGVLPFALGQWTYAISLPVAYYSKTYGMASSGGFSLLAKPIYSIHKSEFILNYFSRPLLWLGCSLFAQSVIKHFLTQGDTLLISYLANLETQGQFALVSNYGGLIARLIFQPIEESSRSYFAKVLSSTSTGPAGPQEVGGKTGEKYDQKGNRGEETTANNKPSKEAIKTASNHLHTLLHFYTLLGLLATILGPPLAPPLLTLIAGRHWTRTTSPTSTPTTTILSTYTYYIPLLSINGLLEAFITAIATPTTLTLQTIFMTSFSLLYILLAYVLLGVYGFGAQGLIWANMINMGVRIVWSSWFIGAYLGGWGERLDWGRVVPGKVVVAVAVGSVGLLRGRGEVRLGALGDVVGFGRTGVVTGEVWELGKVALIMGTFVVTLAVSERQLLLNAYRSIRSR